MKNNTSVLYDILRFSSRNNIIENPTKKVEKILEQLGVKQQSPCIYRINRTKRTEIALMLVTRGWEIERIINAMTWKDFESFVAVILSEHGFRCVESFRRRGNSLTHGMEIDVIGVRAHTILSIDAKMWNIRGGKAAALRKAAEKQKQRTVELSMELDRLSMKIPLENHSFMLFPILVTWLVEDLMIHEGVPIVPIFKLNSFIIDLPIYEDGVVSITGELSKQ